MLCMGHCGINGMKSYGTGWLCNKKVAPGFPGATGFRYVLVKNNLKRFDNMVCIVIHTHPVQSFYHVVSWNSFCL